MDRLTGSVAFAALVLSFTLAGCGGHNASAPAAAPADGGGPTATIEGVSTPPSVSVVTAKNAQ